MAKVNKSVVPVVPAVAAVAVTVEAAKAAFVAGLQTMQSAADTLKAAFGMAVATVIGTKTDMRSRKKLRDTLVEWGTSAGIAKKTVTNNVSRLMKQAGLELRKRGSKEVKATAKEQALSESLLEYLTENTEDGIDTITVLKLALEAAKVAADAEDGEEETESAQSEAVAA